jgi:hypothetical protein
VSDCSTSDRRALTWASPYSEGDSRRSSCAIRPTQFAHFTFPISGTVFRPIHFSLDLVPSPGYYIKTPLIYKITAFFDNLTRAQLLAICQLLSPTSKTKAKTFVRRFAGCAERRRNRPERRANPNV